MKINDDLYVVQVPLNAGGQVRTLNLGLIVDPEHCLTLIDTGMPGQVDAIGEELAKDGLSLGDVTRVLITHHDVDHIGSLTAVVEKTGATVYASAGEAPFIQGEKQIQKYEMLSGNPQFKALVDSMTPTQVDGTFSDGERLELAGGVIVIETPGHTVGHTSFYLERTKSLIVGDALVSENGVLQGPSAGATPDLETAKQSAKKLATFDVETILCYHGGLVTDDANGQLARVASE